MKKLLFILSKPPYADSSAREALDVILTAASFESNLSLLFLDDGIFQLCANQHTDGINVKPMADMLTALPLYGIKVIYAAEQDLLVRGLSKSDLILPVEVLNAKQVTDLLNTADVVFNF